MKMDKIESAEDIGRIAVLYQISQIMSIMVDDRNARIQLEAISDKDSVVEANLKRMRNSLKLISAAIDELLNKEKGN